MKHYVKMVVFVSLLGLLTSGLLMTANILTRDLILENQAAAIRSAILEANNVSFTTATLNDIFEEEIETFEYNGLTLYIHTASGNVSFEFKGDGVWGPIEGVLTLESDFETIKAVKVLQQEETPGLGGVVAEPQYLAKYVGRVMVPELIVSRTADTSNPNEVDAIAGGTRTSNLFQGILNEAYTMHLEAWEQYNE